MRELVAKAGLEVAVLKRVRVGGYRLPRDLGYGQARDVLPAFHLTRLLAMSALDTVPFLWTGDRDPSSRLRRANFFVRPAMTWDASLGVQA